MGRIKFLTADHHGPDGPDILVGQCDGCNIFVSPPNQANEPRVLLLLGFGKADNRSGTVDQ